LGAQAMDDRPVDAPKNQIVIPTPPAGNGQVVFFRNSAMGLAISCAVSENGQKVSSLPPGDYFIAIADPGKHTYAVSSEAKDLLSLEVEPNETQFAICKIKMGIMAGRPTLTPSTDAEFRKHPYKLVKDEKMGVGALRSDGSWGAGTTSASAATASAAPATTAAVTAATPDSAAAPASPPADATAPAPSTM
jgi:hypothetical protein